MSDNGPARYLYTPLKAIGSMLPLWTGSKKQTAVSNRIEPLSTTASVLRPRLICATGSDTEGPASLLGKQDSNEGGDDDSQMSDSDEFVDCDPLPQSLLAINGRIPEDSRKNGCEQSQADASRVIDLPASSNPSKIPSQVRVFLRCKPSIGPKFLKVVTSNEVLFRQKTQTICGAGERVRQKQYFFSRVFEESVDQEEVFVEVALPVVERVFTEHTDELILAFGPSGSGKTYSLGCDGILGRALASILRKADGLLSKVDVTPHGWSGTTAGAVQHTKEVCNQPICTYSVWISFVEIYNGSCYDLLDDCSQNSARRAHKFRVDKDSNPYINEIREMRIESFEEGESLIQRAVVSRSVAATRVNQASSRGHLLVTIKVLKFDGVSSKPKISRLAVADLAGSENSTNSSAGLQLREATKINRGLFNLCRCISAISGGKNGKSEGIIPFRGCQLTTALRPYIQQAHLTFLLHVDPSNENQTREVLEKSKEMCLIVPTQLAATIPLNDDTRRDLMIAAARNRALERERDEAKEEALRWKEEYQALLRQCPPVQQSNANFGHVPRVACVLSAHSFDASSEDRTDAGEAGEQLITALGRVTQLEVQLADYEASYAILHEELEAKDFEVAVLEELLAERESSQRIASTTDRGTQHEPERGDAISQTVSRLHSKASQTATEVGSHPRLVHEQTSQTDSQRCHNSTQTTSMKRKSETSTTVSLNLSDPVINVTASVSAASPATEESQDSNRNDHQDLILPLATSVGPINSHYTFEEHSKSKPVKLGRRFLKLVEGQAPHVDNLPSMEENVDQVPVLAVEFESTFAAEPTTEPTKKKRKLRAQKSEKPPDDSPAIPEKISRKLPRAQKRR